LHIGHLSLKNFRNYLGLEFDLPAGISVFHGANAQGKTNLLESICLLATARLSRRTPDRELINWAAIQEPMPFARVSSEIQRKEQKLHLEVILMPRSQAQSQSDASAMPIQKHLRVNGVDCRATDFIGQLNTVMFSPRDVDLISEEPALRRRYLDITNSQVDSQYLRALQRYNRVLERRNFLLRRIASRQAKPGEMDFWDQELVRSGAYIVFQRRRSLVKLSELSAPIHHRLTDGREPLAIRYYPNLGSQASGADTLEGIMEAFSEALRAAREEELARGVSLIGPHRDDLRFLVEGIDMGTFGSRGQQRTIALSLKLAESGFMRTQTGEMPVLLLDDVLSELDETRRHQLLDAVSGYEQVLMTATDLDRFLPGFLTRAEKFKIENGAIS